MMKKTTVYDKKHKIHILVLKDSGGKAYPYVIVNGRYTKLVTAYHSIRGDILDAQAMLLYIDNTPEIPPLVKTSMFKAFVIQYSKCFTQAKGRGVKVQPEIAFKEHSHLLESHNKLMDMRHNYLAHAGTSEYEYGAMVLYMSNKINNPTIERIIYSDLKFMDHSLELPKYLMLCEKLLDHLNSKLEKLGSFYDQELAKIDLNDLYKRSKIPKPQDWIEMYDVDMINADYPAYR